MNRKAGCACVHADWQFFVSRALCQHHACMCRLDWLQADNVAAIDASAILSRASNPNQARSSVNRRRADNSLGQSFINPLPQTACGCGLDVYSCRWPIHACIDRIWWAQSSRIFISSVPWAAAASSVPPPLQAESWRGRRRTAWHDVRGLLDAWNEGTATSADEMYVRPVISMGRADSACSLWFLLHLSYKI
jgi:hypothetical protein